MQEERSGSSADSVHKSNWPYFLMLDFLRTQFKTRPTSGNLMKKQKTNEDQSVATICDDLSVSKHQLHVENTDEMYAERFSTQDDIDINENGKRLNTDGNVSGKSPECPSSKIDNTVKEDLVHPNTFNKRIVKNDHLKRLVQIEEKKMAILEQKRSRTAHEKSDDDMLFFESLLPHIKKIEGVNKLFFRNDIQNLVIKYAYQHASYDPSRPSTGSSTHQSFLPSGDSAQDTGDNVEISTPHSDQDNDILDLDQWKSCFLPTSK
ncbi:hypothetical protein J6590_098027 [Homalodisca vitripennis]|nr:hypothetical protein J6590_098027 [Homalodisca vitripennis]